MTGADSYDRYCGNACQFVSVDPAGRLRGSVRLAKNGDLRRKLGDQARQRARDTSIGRS